MLYQDMLKIVDEYVEKRHGGNIAAAARELGVKGPAFSRWIKRERTPNAEDLAAILEKLGADLVRPDTAGRKELSREVCFVNARIAAVGNNQAPPQEEDYMAVPLVEEVGAGPGIIPQGELLSWFLVYKHQDAVRYRSNLVAVQIGKHSTSMVPILHPGDVVLVDLDDKDTSKPGRIMLVMDPHDGSGMIKRVAVEQKSSDYRITYYSDNAAQNPPMVYSWREDFAKDWTRVVAGHVVWGWSDLSGK